MPRALGPERAHFGGEDGLITKKFRGKTTYSWACTYCGFEIGGRTFAARKARIHLSGNTELRDGSISQICTEAPEKVKQQFTEIEIAKRKQKEEVLASRKRAAELMAASPELIRERPPSKKQSTLRFRRLGFLKSNEVDDAWTKCFCALDIPPHKIDSYFFKQALEATKKCPAK